MSFLKNNYGFTLLELLTVIGILGVLATALIATINPFEQIKKTQDANIKNAVIEIEEANVRYYTTHNSLAWNINQDCLNEIGTGTTLDNAPSCLDALTNEGELKSGFKNANHILTKIHLSVCQNKAIMCFEPNSLAQARSLETRYNQYGNLNPDCPKANGNALGCYWCTERSDCGNSEGEGNGGNNNGGGNNGGGTGVNPTNPTPTPSNPWGKAISLAGAVPAYSPTGQSIYEYSKTNYSNIMNITNNEVTVEAWIKPKSHTSNIMQGYQIINNTYSITMYVQNDGSDVLYQYNFHIQSTPNGCGQTVVYSGTLRTDPWNLNNYKRVSRDEFETWKHVVGMLKNGTLYIYENGILLNSYNPPSLGHSVIDVCNSGRDLYIGAYGANPTLTYNYFQGYIDEVRVSNIGRYGNSYSVPTQPFTKDSNTTMLYHFDNNANDSSDNNLNGYLVGQVEYIDSDLR